jgi:hypothetical protein
MRKLDQQFRIVGDRVYNVFYWHWNDVGEIKFLQVNGISGGGEETFKTVGVWKIKRLRPGVSLTLERG